MKNAIVSMFILLTAISSYSAEKIVSDKSEELSVLSTVSGVKSIYSKASELNAQVVTLLVGDGMNHTRMVLSLSNGMGLSKTFDLNKSMLDLTRITFLKKDVIVINYSMDDLINDGEKNVVRNKSLIIRVLRDSDGQITDEITVETK